MEDVNSVYVGGLSYESSEDTVKKAFMEFGEVVSVKIVYDRESGESRGFGFVTFTNPRSATMAIRDMDGGQIEGRTIRVNEVRKNLKGLGFRDRDRDFRSRDMRERIRRRSPPSRERIHHRTRSPPLQRSRSPTPIRSSPVGRGSSPAGRGSSPNGSALGRFQSPEAKERSGRSARSSASPQSSEENQRKEETSIHKGGSKLSSRIAATDKEDEEVRQLKEELEKATENGKGLEEKILSLKGVVEKADVTIAALKTKSLKLEESLANAQQLAAQRQFQLKRLQTGVFHFKLATERLANCEKEMKALATLTSLEVDHDSRIIINNPDQPDHQLPNGFISCNVDADIQPNHKLGDREPENLMMINTT